MRKSYIRVLACLALALSILLSLAPSALASGTEIPGAHIDGGTIFVDTADGVTLDDAIELCGEYEDVFIYIREYTETSGRVVIPENLCLIVEDCELKIPEGSELVLNGSMMFERANLTICGIFSGGGWVDLDESSFILYMYGASYEHTGSIFSEDFSIFGLDEEEFDHDSDLDIYRHLSETEREQEKNAPAPTPAPQQTRSDPGALSYTDPSTGFEAVVLDDLGLLSKSEREKLLEDMKPLLKFGNIAFWTTNEYTSQEVKQAQQKRRSLFELESASILVINMNVRRISIQSYGEMYDVITTTRANEITNYVRNYGTRGEYYDLARIAFGQMEQLMRGNRIARPMKHFSNACIALMAGLIVMFLGVFRYASTFRRPDIKEMALAITGGAFTLGAAKAVHTGQSRVYSPPSSDSGSSGSSCSSCGGGGGSSCSSCGGGGSSSF